MSDDRQPGRPTPFIPPREVAAGENVGTLLADWSHGRATIIFNHQFKQQGGFSKSPFVRMRLLGEEINRTVFSSPEATKHAIEAMAQLKAQYAPERYVIPYHVPPRDQPISQELADIFNKTFSAPVETVSVTDAYNDTYQVKVPHVRIDNPVEPLNAHMERAVAEAFATIEAQLPGRFVFVPTNDPKEALLNFAAIPTSDTIIGVSLDNEVLLVRKAFANDSAYSSAMAHTVLHEIGHGLGLAHPHLPHERTQGEKVPPTNKATYFDTAMTYGENNRRQSARAANDLPVSLMPLDLEALRRIYPIKSDAEPAVTKVMAAAIASPVKHYQTILKQASVQGVIQTPIPMVERGVIYHPIADTERDTLRVERNDGRLNVIRQMPQGISVSLYDYTHRPDDHAEVFLPVHVENIVLSGGGSLVTVNGNVSIFAPLHAGAERDQVNFKGRNNHLDVDAQMLIERKVMVNLAPGAQATITLRGSDQLKEPSQQVSEIISFSDRLPVSSVVQWADHGNGHFQWRWHEGSAPHDSSIEVAFQLENPTAESIALFRKFLSESDWRSSAPIIDDGPGVLFNKKIPFKEVAPSVLPKFIVPLPLPVVEAGVPQHGLPDVVKSTDEKSR